MEAEVERKKDGDEVTLSFPFKAGTETTYLDVFNGHLNGYR